MVNDILSPTHIVSVLEVYGVLGKSTLSILKSGIKLRYFYFVAMTFPNGVRGVGLYGMSIIYLKEYYEIFSSSHLNRLLS